MKYLIAIFVGLVCASAYPSYTQPYYAHPYAVHPGVGAIYRGPNSETILKGPDGSVITAEAVGGAVAIEPEPVVIPAKVEPFGPVAPFVPLPLVPPVHFRPIAPIPPIETHFNPIVPLVETSVVKTGPVILRDHPIIVPEIAVAEHSPKIVEEHIIVGGKVITVPKAVEESSDLIGPSGTISTRGGDVVISGPASTTIKGGGVVASIEKQPDIPIKTIEVKPVVAPAVVKPIAPVVSSFVAPVVAHTAVHSLNPAPVFEPFLNSGPLVSQPRPLLPIRRPIYAEGAPIIAHPRLLHDSAGPLLRTDLVHSNVVPNYGNYGNYGHGILPLNYGRPLYGGPHH